MNTVVALLLLPTTPPFTRAIPTTDSFYRGFIGGELEVHNGATVDGSRAVFYSHSESERLQLPLNLNATRLLHYLSQTAEELRGAVLVTGVYGVGDADVPTSVVHLVLTLHNESLLAESVRRTHAMNAAVETP
ncbi:hypothetical protein [Mycolicibacter arupensis]|uniref:Uncharacterized protein n=1 Tax=Mycolicibacter arupensis TaxID=342002 RepID=A0A5C7Y432_9MYCO|nr:hypothetical protein [Mycolicibacter arupensis]TXI55944.1 MAG: hypothetical protein E6Q54_12005 [Mycolicibacter arupensis]